MLKPSDAAVARRRPTISLFVPAAVAIAALGGCDEYLERRDTLTYGAGDAVAVNRATQTIERWPQAARYDRWGWDGERARLATERYRRREIKIEPPEPTSGSTSATTSSGP